MAAKTRRAKNGHGKPSSKHGAFDDLLALAGTLAQNRRSSGAEMITSLATATRGFAGEMPEILALKSYAESAADRLDELSDYVAETEFEEIVDDARNLARNHPIALLGLTVAGGWWAARLMQSAAHDTPTPQRRKAT